MTTEKKGRSIEDDIVVVTGKSIYLHRRPIAYYVGNCYSKGQNVVAPAVQSPQPKKKARNASTSTPPPNTDQKQKEEVSPSSNVLLSVVFSSITMYLTLHAYHNSVFTRD